MIAGLALFWIAARQIYTEIRTPREPIFDFSVLCTVIGWIVVAAATVLMAHSSLRLFQIVQKRARGAAPARLELAGPVMRVNVLLVVAWAILGVLTWNYLIAQPYVRLVPEPSEPIPAGETATFRVEADPGMGIRVQRAYRPAGQCGTDDVYISADDGDLITVEACSPGVGLIRISGFGGSKEYQLGTPVDGAEAAHHHSFSYVERNLMVPYTTFHNTVNDEWRFDLEETGLRLVAMDWIPGQEDPSSEGAVIIVRTWNNRPLPSLDDYYMDIFRRDGSRLVRLDFENSRRIDPPAVPPHMRRLYEDRRVYLDRSVILHWSPCAKPQDWGGGVASASIVEKSPTYDSSSAPGC